MPGWPHVLCPLLPSGQAARAGDTSVPLQSLPLCAPAEGGDIPCARIPPLTASPPISNNHPNTSLTLAIHTGNGSRELPRNLLPRWEKPVFIHPPGPDSPESQAPAPHAALGHRGTLSRDRRDFTPKLMQPISSLCLQDNQSSGTVSTRLLKHQIPPCTPFQGAPKHPCPCWEPGSAQDVPLPRGVSRHGVTTGLSCSRARRSWAEAPWSPPGAGSSLAKEADGTCLGWQHSLQGARPLGAPRCTVPRGRGGPSPLRPRLALASSAGTSGCRGLNAGPADGYQAAAMATECQGQGLLSDSLPVVLTSTGCP